MRRREFLNLVGGVAALPAISPGTAWAQPADKVYRVGLTVGRSAAMSSALLAFRGELRKLGFVEGRNLVIDRRSSQENKEHLFAAAADLVRLQTDVLVASTYIGVDAAVAASPTTPIVLWANNYDPIGRGYVKTLAQPGGRITGVFNRQPELAEKQVELLREAFPERKRLGVMWDNLSVEQFESAERRAKALGFELQSIKFERLPYDIPAAFRALADRSAQLLLVLSTPYVALYQREIVKAALDRKLPAMFIFRTYVVFGGLMSYGIPIETSFRRVASLVAKILRGARPSDLPVEQPNQYEFVVNLKAAKAMEIELPTSILLRADEVIE